MKSNLSNDEKAQGDKLDKDYEQKIPVLLTTKKIIGQKFSKKLIPNEKIDEDVFYPIPVTKEQLFRANSNRYKTLVLIYSPIFYFLEIGWICGKYTLNLWRKNLPLKKGILAWGFFFVSSLCITSFLDENAERNLDWFLEDILIDHYFDVKGKETYINSNIPTEDEINYKKPYHKALENYKLEKYREFTNQKN